MSYDKITVRGNKYDGVVVDINDDVQNYEINHNSGNEGIVVMVGGIPKLVGAVKHDVPRGLPTKEELEAKEKAQSEDDPIKSEARTTILPDALSEDSTEEILIYTKIPIIKKVKQITRIDVNSASEVTPTPISTPEPNLVVEKN